MIDLTVNMAESQRKTLMSINEMSRDVCCYFNEAFNVSVRKKGIFKETK